MKLHAKFGEAGACGCRDMMYRRKYQEKNGREKNYGEKNDREKNDREKNDREKNYAEKNDREKNYGEKNEREKNSQEKNGQKIPILDPKWPFSNNDKTQTKSNFGMQLTAFSFS